MREPIKILTCGFLDVKVWVLWQLSIFKEVSLLLRNGEECQDIRHEE